MSVEAPNIMGAVDSHGTIRRVLLEQPPCRVLDAAAGEGPLSRFLVDNGWDVLATDIDRDDWCLDDVPFVEADLNHALPFEDESFDAVVFANAVHRLYNPAGAIREFYRILRPGGRLYLNANNFASIDLRLRFLLFGSFEYRPPENWSNPSVAPEGTVRTYINYGQLANHIEAAGFDIVRLLPAAVRLRHRLMAPVAWIVRAATWMIPKSKADPEYVSASASGAILSGGYYYLVEAKKPEIALQKKPEPSTREPYPCEAAS